MTKTYGTAANSTINIDNIAFYLDVMVYNPPGLDCYLKACTNSYLDYRPPCVANILGKLECPCKACESHRDGIESPNVYSHISHVPYGGFLMDEPRNKKRIGCRSLCNPTLVP